MENDEPATVAECIRLLYRQTGPVLAANLINSALVTAGMWQRVDDWRLTIWVAAMAVLTSLRALLWIRYLGRAREDAEMALWGRLFTVGSTVSGAVWGSAALLFVMPGDPLSLMLIVFVLGGMAAGAMAGLGSHLPAFYLYVSMSVVPLEIRILSFGDRASMAMGGMLALFIVGMVVIGRSFNQALVRRIQLSEQNRILLSGMEQEVRNRTAELLDANGRLREEVAERRRAERALDEARGEAVRANQAKSRFLAAASHDLRQPMQSLFLFSQALHGHINDNPGRNVLIMLERGLDILKDLLDSLLDVSRLDVNVIRPQFGIVPLRPLFAELAAAYQPIGASKGLNVAALDPGEVCVHSDPVLLGRMLRNLVENAVRYTEKGGVVIVARCSGDTVLIEVSDTGIGIPADQLSSIFEEFHQVANPARDKSQGLGLGLAIVQRLSAILRHPVDVQSVMGDGSTFSVEVPLESRPEATVPAQIADPCAEGSGGRGRLIVLVDDDPLVLIGLRSVFLDWGYQVVVAGCSDEAVELLRGEQRTPALVVADFRLRGGSEGTEVVKAVRSLYGSVIPGVILTGETGPEPIRKVTDLGLTLVHKPVTSHQLAYVVGDLIR